MLESSHLSIWILLISFFMVSYLGGGPFNFSRRFFKRNLELTTVLQLQIEVFSSHLPTYSTFMDNAIVSVLKRRLLQIGWPNFESCRQFSKVTRVVAVALCPEKFGEAAG